MPAGKYGSTNMAFRPGVACAMAADVAASAVNTRLQSFFSQSHVDFWLSQGVYGSWYAKANWRSFYTNQNVKPTDPTDHTDPGYNWSLMDGWVNMSIWSLLGPGMIVSISINNGGQPQWFNNAGYSWTNSNNIGQVRWDLSAARQEIKDFYTAFYSRYKNNRQFWSIVFGEVLNGASAWTDSNGIARTWPSGYNSVVAGAGIGDVVNTVCLQWQKEISVIQMTPSDNVVANLIPEIGYATPDLKMFTNGCTPTCSVGTNRAIIQGAFQNRVLIQMLQLNGMDPVYWPNVIDNPFGYSSSTPSHVPTMQEAIWYVANIVKSHVLVYSPIEWQNAAVTQTLANIYQANDLYMAGGNNTFPPLPSNYDPEPATGGGSTSSDVVIKDVLYTANTSTGTANTAHGQGSTPKYVRNILTAATALDTSGGTAKFSYGATDLTNQRALSYRLNSGVTPSASSKIGKTTDISLYQLSGSTTVDGEAAYSSIGGTNVVINTTNAYASAYLGVLSSIAGTDASVALTSITLGNDGTTSDISVGFVPTHVKITSIHRSLNGTSEDGATFSYGAATNEGGISQWCFSRNDPNGVSSPAGRGAAQLRNDCVVTKLDSSGAVTWSAAITAWGSTITLTVTGNANADIIVEAFKFNNCTVLASIIDSPTTAQVTVPNTYPLTFPVAEVDRAELLVTQLTSINTAFTTAPAGEWGFSLLDVVNDTEFTMWWRTRISNTNQVSSTFIETDAFDYSAHDNASTPVLAGTVDSNSDSDIVISWTTVPATAIKMGAISYQFSTDVDTTQPVLAGTSIPTGSATGQTSIDWNWSDATDADGYLVESSLDGTNWAQVADVAVSAYSQTGLIAATNYYLRYRAYNNGSGLLTGYSTTSAAVATDTPADTVAPVGCALTSATFNAETREITFVWTQGTDAVSAAANITYNLYGALSPASINYSNKIDSFTGDITGAIVNVDVAGLAAGTWSFVVRAQDVVPNEDTNTTSKTVTITSFGYSGTFGPLENGSGTILKDETIYIYRCAYGGSVMISPSGAANDPLAEAVTVDSDGLCTLTGPTAGVIEVYWENASATAFGYDTVTLE